MKCPYCKEEILQDAVKCKHCGEWLIQQKVLKENIKKVHAKQHDSYQAFTAIALLLPLVGFILGIIYLTKHSLLERKLGEHTITMSVVGTILSYVILGAFDRSLF